MRPHVIWALRETHLCEVSSITQLALHPMGQVIMLSEGVSGRSPHPFSGHDTRAWVLGVAHKFRP